jgi:hypothetical protein
VCGCGTWWVWVRGGAPTWGVGLLLSVRMDRWKDDSLGFLDEEARVVNLMANVIE